MNRRDLLKRLLGAGIIAVADPEKLLWQPGEKVHFVITRPDVPLSLMGVPYHQSNASTDQWLGIMRQTLNKIGETIPPEQAKYVFIDETQRKFYESLDLKLYKEDSKK